MTLSGGEKAFLTFDVSGGPGMPVYELIQLDENPGRPMYGWLILEKNPQKPGRGFVDVFTGTQEQREKLFGRGNTGLQISHAALKYSGELAHILKRHGSLRVPHGRYGYDMGTLSDLWREGVDENDLDGFGFEIGDNGLVDASAITLSYARSALSDKLNDPMSWLGLAAVVALFASGEAVVVGGLSLLGIGGTAISSDEYSARWDRGESHSWRAEDALKRGDRRGANLRLVEMAAHRGLVLGGAADFVIKAGVASGAARFVSAESVPARAGTEAPMRAGADTAGRPIRWAPPNEPTPTEMPLPGGSGTTTGSGGTTAVNSGLQAFGYVPGRTRTVTGPGGLQTETYQPPVYLGLEDIAPLTGDVAPVRPAAIPDTPAVSAQSPLPAFIIPPLGDERDPSVVEYEMPGGETGVIFVPGIDDSSEAIGDRPENSTPIGDAPSRAERIGDPAISHGPIFAPGTDNRTRFAAGGADEPDKITPAGSHATPADAPQEVVDREPQGEDSLMTRLRKTANNPYWQQSEQTRVTYGFPVPVTPEVIAGGNRLAKDDSHDEVDRVGPFVVIFRSPAHLGPYKEAVDFVVPDGTDVLAMEDGVVKEVRENSDRHGDDPSFAGQGNYVTIKHENGERSQYFHLARESVTRAGIRVGSRVRRGQKIGTVGMSGWTTREHLHIIVFRSDGHLSNPFGFKSLKIQWKHDFRWWVGRILGKLLKP